MSAPTAEHEDRVRAIADLASLAGYVIDMALFAGQRPDIVRLHRSRLALLVGDGKATESPSDGPTRRRLGTYVATARLWMAAGFEVCVVIAHRSDPRHAWLACLTETAEASRIGVASPSCFTVDKQLWISTVSLVMA